VVVTGLRGAEARPTRSPTTGRPSWRSWDSEVLLAALDALPDDCTPRGLAS